MDLSLLSNTKILFVTKAKSTAIIHAIALLKVISREKDEKLGLEDDDRFTLVMDAPFAKLDLSHRKNVTSLIPTLTDQIILFSADSQWDGVVEDALKNKIGLMYNIDKNGTTSSIRLIEKEVQ